MINEIQVTDSIVIRWKQSLAFLGIIVTVVSANLELLHLNETWKDVVTLVCLIILALNRPVVYKE